MSEITNDKSINQTLNVIRKALQEEDANININEEALILNQLVKEDGTIVQIESINKQQVKKILHEKLSEVFDQHFEKWLNKNIPDYLDKYFAKK
jgi:hypothetical protein